MFTTADYQMRGEALRARHDPALARTVVLTAQEAPGDVHLVKIDHGPGLVDPQLLRLLAVVSWRLYLSRVGIADPDDARAHARSVFQAAVTAQPGAWAVRVILFTGILLGSFMGGLAGMLTVLALLVAAFEEQFFAPAEASYLAGIGGSEYAELFAEVDRTVRPEPMGVGRLPAGPPLADLPASWDDATEPGAS